MFGRGECRAGDEKKTSKKRLTNVMGAIGRRESTVGAGLPAMAVVWPPDLLADTPLLQLRSKLEKT